MADAGDFSTLSIRDLKQELSRRQLDYSGLSEKSELVELLRKASCECETDQSGSAEMGRRHRYNSCEAEQFARYASGKHDITGQEVERDQARKGLRTAQNCQAPPRSEHTDWEEQSGMAVALRRVQSTCPRVQEDSRPSSKHGRVMDACRLLKF